MRNPYRTCRKRSTKPFSKLSKRKKERWINKVLSSAKTPIQKWFVAYMAKLKADADDATVNNIDPIAPK